MLRFHRFMSPTMAQRFAKHCQDQYGRRAAVATDYPLIVEVEQGDEIYERYTVGKKENVVSLNERIERDVYSFSGQPAAESPARPVVQARKRKPDAVTAQVASEIGEALASLQW